MTTATDSGPIRLVSGTSLRTENSFNRQLRLLERAFADLGHRAVVSGPPFEELYLPGGGTLGGVKDGLTDVVEAPADGAAADRARILLGYPDQFPFVMNATGSVTSVPTFLWTQLSGPPKRAQLAFYRKVRPVALTERSWSFLAAGVRRFFTGGIPIIPHGVDTALFRPAAGDERRLERVAKLKRELDITGNFVVGTVAANTFRKRYDRMFEAFALFLRRLHGKDGKDEKDRRERPCFVVKTDRIRALDGRDLRELAQRYDLEEEVRFAEHDVSDDELVSLFCCFDLYLNLSEWEGFCIPVIEAMACGVPVVSHDVQGPGELLPYAELVVPGSMRNTDEGVLLLDASPEQAGKVLERAYRSSELRQRSVELGRAATVELYDIHRVAQSWIDLFSELPAAEPETPEEAED